MPSFGAEWSVQPSIGMKGYYNSNLLLTPLPHKETYGYWVSPAAEFAGKTERLEVTGRAAADFVTYYGGQESKFTNIFLPLSTRYKTEKDQFAFTGGFTRDNTLMGELQTTGVVLQFTQRNQWTATPSWTRSLTEKLSIQSTFQFNDTTYENGLRLGLVDYQLFGGSTGLAYQATERDQVQLTGTYANFHTTNGSFTLRATFPGAMGTVTHAFSESMTATAFGGPRFINATTHSTSTSVTTNETVWVYGASISKQFERASIQANLSRDIVPSGFGLLIRTDRAGLSASYNVSETLTATLDTTGIVVEGVTTRAQGGTLPKYTYVFVTPKLAWKFAEWWKLDLSYSYGLSEVRTYSEAGISNAATLMLTFYPPKFSRSQ